MLLLLLAQLCIAGGKLKHMAHVAIVGMGGLHLKDLNVLVACRENSIKLVNRNTVWLTNQERGSALTSQPVILA